MFTIPTVSAERKMGGVDGESVGSVQFPEEPLQRPGRYVDGGATRVAGQVVVRF